MPGGNRCRDEAGRDEEGLTRHPLQKTHGEVSIEEMCKGAARTLYLRAEA
jgi:hypothetical protein